MIDEISPAPPKIDASSQQGLSQQDTKLSIKRELQNVTQNTQNPNKGAHYGVPNGALEL